MKKITGRRAIDFSPLLIPITSLVVGILAALVSYGPLDSQNMGFILFVWASYIAPLGFIAGVVCFAMNRILPKALRYTTALCILGTVGVSGLSAVVIAGAMGV
jgi:hypothetical protein